MLTMVKKQKRILALLLCMLLLLSSCDWLEDEEESYAADSTSTAESTESKLSTNDSVTVTETSATTTVSLFDSSAVRSKLTDTSTAETVTIMIYMNGSNLESDDGSATEDITEMLKAPQSDNVNIVMQTMGTKSWSSKYGISSKRTQRWLLAESDLTLVDDSLSQLDCTESATLSDFIIWSAANYPADRYILIFWDHGGGPVYGFGYDEWVSDEEAALTIDEIQMALSKGGVTFDWIGFDACIMSCLEVCCAFYDYCDYMIVSEEFEPGTGWSYEGWLTALAANPAIDTESLAKILIDDMIASNSGSDGDTATLALIDESLMKVLFTAWVDFAYANEDSLLGSNYSQKIKKSSRAFDFFSDWLWDDDDDYSLSDYYITDIMAVAQNIDSDESDVLSSAVSNAVVYYSATSDVTSLTGISVTLPYGDSDFYSDLKTIFTNCGFDTTYIAWLENFTSAEGVSSFYDYDDEWDDWSGWDDYEDDYDWSCWDCYDEDEEYWSDLFDWVDWIGELFWGDDWYDDDDDWYDDDDAWYEDDEEGGFWSDFWSDDDDDDWYDDEEGGFWSDFWDDDDDWGDDWGDDGGWFDW